MFRQPVVFVVGAGASVDYGFPLGGRLASDIADDVDFYFDHYKSSEPTKGDPKLFWLLRQKFQSDQETLKRYLDGGRLLASALTSAVSIDDALYRLSERPEIVELGKVCILRNLLRSERESELKIDSSKGRPMPDAGKNGWIEHMFSMAISDLKLSEFYTAFKKITFVNFNYDRCIEHYLYWALQRQGIGEPEASAIVDNLNMIRPYGALGSIVRGKPDYLAFGEGAPLDHFGLMHRIRTYTESEVLHDQALVENIVASATMIVFLGFGFHRQNMDLVRVSPDRGSRNVRVLATVYGVDHGNLPELSDELRAILRSERAVDLYPMTAPEMLSKLRLKIMMTAG